MVRLYWNMVHTMYVALIWLRYVGGVRDFRGIREDVKRFYNNGSVESTQFGGSIAVSLQNIADNEEFGIDGMIKFMDEKIRSNKSEDRDGDLLDIVVRILGLPYSQAILSGKTMGLLKKALLLPEEIVKLKDHIEAQEKACVSCGREFSDNEAVVSFKAVDGSPKLLYCFACYTPTLIGCSSCGEKALFGTLYTKKKIKCADHKIKVEEEPEVKPDLNVEVAAPRVVVNRYPPIRPARQAAPVRLRRMGEPINYAVDAANMEPQYYFQQAAFQEAANAIAGPPVPPRDLRAVAAEERARMEQIIAQMAINAPPQNAQVDFEMDEADEADE